MCIVHAEKGTQKGKYINRYMQKCKNREIDKSKSWNYRNREIVISKYREIEKNTKKKFIYIICAYLIEELSNV